MSAVSARTIKLVVAADGKYIVLSIKMSADDRPLLADCSLSSFELLDLGQTLGQIQGRYSPQYAN